MLDCNLEYYRSFYYVARLHSITKAADALFLSQPAITRSIKLLESHLGCRLFVRTSKGMQLTHEGDVLFTHVSKAFDSLIAGEHELAVASSFGDGKLEIGATETALHHFLLPKIEAFRNIRPNVYIHVTGSSTPETLRMIREGSADLAVAVSPVAPVEGITCKRLQSFHDIFIAGDKYSDLKNRSLSAQEISNYSITTVEKGTSARSHIDKWFEEQGIIFNPAFSVRTTTAVLPFVERNLSIGIVPSMFADSLIEQDKVFRVEMTKPIPPRDILLMHKDSPNMPVICREFVEYLERT